MGIGWLAAFAWILWASTVGMVSAGEMAELRVEVAELGRGVGKVDGKIDAQKIDLIEQRVFNTRLSQCDSEGELRTVYTERLTELIGQWRDLTGNRVGFPTTYVDCSDSGA